MELILFMDKQVDQVTDDDYCKRKIHEQFLMNFSAVFFYATPL